MPAQYNAASPAAVMVFQDGAGPKDYVPTVFDNLIAKRDMPVTVGVFIQPGVFKDGGRANRSFEYDTLSDQYARFLLEEILPEVEKTVKLRHDAGSRAIAGPAAAASAPSPSPGSGRTSSARCCRGSAASRTSRAARRCARAATTTRRWSARRRRSRSACSCRTAPTTSTTPTATGRSRTRRWRSRSPLRGYDYRFEFGNGFHSNRHGRAMLPDTLRWLWRGYQP